MCSVAGTGGRGLKNCSSFFFICTQTESSHANHRRIAIYGHGPSTHAHAAGCCCCWRCCCCCCRKQQRCNFAWGALRIAAATMFAILHALSAHAYKPQSAVQHSHLCPSSPSLISNGSSLSPPCPSRSSRSPLLALRLPARPSLAPSLCASAILCSPAAEMRAAACISAGADILCSSMRVQRARLGRLQASARSVQAAIRVVGGRPCRACAVQTGRTARRVEIRQGHRGGEGRRHEHDDAHGGRDGIAWNGKS